MRAVRTEEIKSKVCVECLKRKPVKCFYELKKYDRRYLSHWCSRCIDCETTSVKARNKGRCKASRAATGRKYRETHPLQMEAKRLSDLALKRGTLVRPDHCERCGNHKSVSPIQKHHEDYAKALEVWWLCKKKCHPKADAARIERIARGEVAQTDLIDNKLMPPEQATTTVV